MTATKSILAAREAAEVLLEVDRSGVDVELAGEEADDGLGESDEDGLGDRAGGVIDFHLNGNRLQAQSAG